MTHTLFPIIGGKCRASKRIAAVLESLPGDCLIEVFGGSAAVMLASSFVKRVYNDADGDLVNLMRVVATDPLRVKLFRQLKWLPPSRELFEKDRDLYVSSGLSFSQIADPVDRARATFYRLSFAYGAKLRSGGFCMTWNDRKYIKEIQRYRSALTSLSRFGHYFRNTVIENRDYQTCIERHGHRDNCILYADPPYIGTENYYSAPFTKYDHRLLAWALNDTKCPVVVSYYDVPELADLYPSPRWRRETFDCIANTSSPNGCKKHVTELLLIKTKEAV